MQQIVNLKLLTLVVTIWFYWLINLLLFLTKSGHNPVRAEKVCGDNVGKLLWFLVSNLKFLYFFMGLC